MKPTGKKLTLSGQMPKRAFPQQIFRDPHTILEYSNVLDISKAWKVIDFKCWIQETGADMTLTGSGQVGIDVQLSSDDITPNSAYNNAGDNRAVGWGTLTYYFGDGQYKPQNFTGVSRMLINSEYFIMPDHVVQNKLIISSGAAGSSQDFEGQINGYTLNYIVELEEMDITPTESIIFNIKSKAQDV